MHVIRFACVVAGALALTACQKTYVPPQAAPPRPVVQTRASVDATWNAAITVLTGAGIPIQSQDRASGTIVAAADVPADQAAQWASCGSVGYRDAEGQRQSRTLQADRAEYSVVVRRTKPVLRVIQTGSSVRVNVRWIAHARGIPGHPDNTVTCETTNVWEGQLEQRIQATAEHR